MRSFLWQKITNWPMTQVVFYLFHPTQRVIISVSLCTGRKGDKIIKKLFIQKTKGLKRVGIKLSKLLFRVSAVLVACVLIYWITTWLTTHVLLWWNPPVVTSQMVICEPSFSANSPCIPIDQPPPNYQRALDISNANMFGEFMGYTASVETLLLVLLWAFAKGPENEKKLP